MDARRISALLSLGLIGAAVVGLVATSGGDDSPTPAAAPAATAAGTDDDPVSSLASDDAISIETTPTGVPVDGGVESAIEAGGDAATTEPTTTVDPNTPDLADRGPHPDFLPVQEWLQTDATSFDDFDGKVIAVQFWTFGCNNCQATFPHMRDLYEKYGGDDFEIVGVHAPEFDYERDVDSIAAEAEENGLTWPIAVDNDKANFRSWQERRFWPRLFLIDADGNIRYDHIGEGAYDEIDAAVGALIAEGRA